MILIAREKTVPSSLARRIPLSRIFVWRRISIVDRPRTFPTSPGKLLFSLATIDERGRSRKSEKSFFFLSSPSSFFIIPSLPFASSTSTSVHGELSASVSWERRFVSFPSRFHAIVVSTNRYRREFALFALLIIRRRFSSSRRRSTSSGSNGKLEDGQANSSRDRKLESNRVPMGNYRQEIGEIEIKRWNSNSKEPCSRKRSNKFYYFKSWGYERLKNNWFRDYENDTFDYINIESVRYKSTFSSGSDASHDRKLTGRHHATIVLAHSRLESRSLSRDMTRYLARFSSYNPIFPFINGGTFPNGVPKKRLAITTANCIIA